MVNFIALPLLLSAATVVYGHGTFVAVKGANGMTGRALAVDPASQCFPCGLTRSD